MCRASASRQMLQTTQFQHTEADRAPAKRRNRPRQTGFTVCPKRLRHIAGRKPDMGIGRTVAVIFMCRASASRQMLQTTQFQHIEADRAPAKRRNRPRQTGFTVCPKPNNHVRT